MRTLTSQVTGGLIAIFAIAIGLYALTFVTGGDLSGFVSSKGELARDLTWRIMFTMHTFGGGLALLVGWSQFWRRLRAARINLHRILGRIYVGSVLFMGGLGGLYIAFFANGGFANDLGFTLLAIMWLYTTWQAYRMVKRKDFERHKVWMIRSYALCLAAVTLRLWIPILAFGFKIPSSEAYAAVVWLCWVPNMIIGEFVIEKGWIK